MPSGTLMTLYLDNAATSFPKPEPVCANCATVTAITPIAVEGGASGAGAAIGAVVGGLLGNQVGDGKGRDVATIAGAIGGGLAGNEIEKRRNESTMYDIALQYETGGSTIIRVTDPGLLMVGTKVRLDGGTILPR